MGGHFLCIFVCRSEGYVCGSQMTTSDVGFHLPPYLKQDCFFWLKALKPATLVWKRAPVVPTSTSYLEVWVLRLWMYDTVSRLKWVLGTQTQVLIHAWWTNSSAPWGMISCRERKKAGMHWRRGIGHTRVSTKNDKGFNATIRLRWGG